LNESFRYFLRLAYHGAAYHGWQVQSNGITVQEKLDAALSLLLKAEIRTYGCGRTDTGVHARCFYAQFDLQSILEDADLLVFKLNSILPKDIVVFEILPVREKAHARFSAVSRTYRYYFHFHKNPFLEGQSWRLMYELNPAPVFEALRLLPGSGDYSCFSRSNADHEHGLCHFHLAELKIDDQSGVFTFTANRFLRNMVRAMVGTLIWVGREKISVDDFAGILKSGKRSEAGESAPAHGLFLEDVQYPEDIWLRP
jgi:tRNA pseudouridine38-40 synthase